MSCIENASDLTKREVEIDGFTRPLCTGVAHEVFFHLESNSRLQVLGLVNGSHITLHQRPNRLVHSLLAHLE